jgi:hypothetical protein
MCQELNSSRLASSRNLSARRVSSARAFASFDFLAASRHRAASLRKSSLLCGMPRTNHSQPASKYAIQDNPFGYPQMDRTRLAAQRRHKPHMRPIVGAWGRRGVRARSEEFNRLWDKMLGRAERVIPVIVDGEPGDPEREYFPPALRCKVTADGQITDEREEPIAADAHEQGDGRLNWAHRRAAGGGDVRQADRCWDDRARRRCAWAHRHRVGPRVWASGPLAQL